MDKIYFIIEDGVVSQPYSLNDLLTKNINESTLVCKKFEDWKKASEISEIAELFMWSLDSKKTTFYETSSSPEETNIKSTIQEPKSETNQVPLLSNNDDKITCPRCGSTNIHIDKKGFGGGKACCGAAVCGPIGLLLGNKGANKLRKTCLKCNNSWS